MATSSTTLNQVRTLVGTMIDAALEKAQYKVKNTQSHNHDGLNSLQIDPSNLKGFPIVTSVPSNTASSGTIVIYTDSITSPTVAHWYVRVGTTWVKVT